MAKQPQRRMTPSEEAAWLDREISRMESDALADSMMTDDEREDLDDWASGFDQEEL